ncbi:hypothetical protein SC81_23165, partial [Vibrio vulnificus]|uniref:hypothetical protein n=1 Tax=Vibrio vulnificus TaxID=672 RepID=UPI000CC197E1
DLLVGQRQRALAEQHQRFKIVFSGELMPDASLETVKDNLARLFKSEPGKIDALFGGRPVVLKRELPEAEAER